MPNDEDELSKQVAAAKLLINPSGPASWVLPVLDNLFDALRTTRAESARRLEMLVWGVNHAATLWHDSPIGHIDFWTEIEKIHSYEVECDGTPASIERAIERVMGGSSDADR